MNGFEVVELEKPSLLGKLFGKKIAENGYREVQNLVATAPIFQIFDADVGNVLARHGVTREVAAPRLAEMYATVARHFAKDGSLSQIDLDQLDRLRTLFGL